MGPMAMTSERPWIALLVLFLNPLACDPALGEPLGSVEEELDRVRDAGAELYTRQSSVFGQLPGPEELAAHQARCRPLPAPRAGVNRELSFDAATRERAAGLDPMELRKAKGRLGMTVVPLGITGAYVVEAAGRTELLVVHVLEDSPATAVLRLDDIIIGANGRLFVDRDDPRPEMGHALCESQSKELGAILTLQIVRDRTPRNVQMDLGSTLGYSPTWPYDCGKTRQVRADALRFVMESHPWHRYDFWTGLFLMASGDDAALELARRELLADLKDEYAPATGSSTWTGGYKLTRLCEYYLLTGDSSVLPLIRHTAEGVAWAQYRSGSWSHGGSQGPNVPEPGTAGGGYGEVNNAGLGALIGLCLARQCGIEPFDHTIPRSIRFFGPFCGENLGYGLGTPSDSRTGRMDNGMNGMSALVFHLLGEDDMAERWARSVCYMWMGRERGHADAIFSAAWGPVTAALAPRSEFHAFMNHMTWAYEMGRARDGGLNFMRGSRWTYPNMTAAYGLFLYLPEKRLQILGGDSVFAKTPPKGLERAARLYREKKWEELTGFLDTTLDGTAATDPRREYASQLLAAYQRLAAHADATLGFIGKNIAADNMKTANLQLDMLDRMMGREWPGAAALRARITGDPAKLRDASPIAKPGPLMDARKIMAELKLEKGGVGDGWAHDGDYIAAVNQQGFEGMTPEQIAPFVGHFSGGVAGGAIRALAAHGESTLPLLKRMLGDSHPGIRAGALAVLTELYAPDIEDFRTEIPDDLAGVIQLVRTMLDDDSKLVRAAVSNFVISIRVLNADVYEMIHRLAEQGSDVGKFVRHGVKDPQVRTRLGMAIIDSNNKRRIRSPGAYIPMICVTSAHLDLCEPYMQTAIDTIHNPEVQVMYGFFSNHPEDAALSICHRFPDHPLVLQNLPAIMRISWRRGEPSTYWDVHREYPHRIAIQLGTKSLPAIETFWTEMAQEVERIGAGGEAPYWWQPQLAETFEENRRHWADTHELILCLSGRRPVDAAVEGMVRHCFQDRWWSAWERARIWDALVAMGPDVLPRLRRSTAAVSGPRLAGMAGEIADTQAKIEAVEDRDVRRKLEKTLAQFELQQASLKERLAELEELAKLIERLHADQPTPDTVRALCAFYLRDPFGAQYPYHKDGNAGHIRPLHAKQDQQIRDLLVTWGNDALPVIRKVIAEDREVLAKRLEALDLEAEDWKTKWARKASGPLKRIANERLILPEMRRELQDLADLIALSKKQKLNHGQLETLCGIYTANDWPPQREMIRDILKRHGVEAEAVIEQHAKTIQPVLSQARATVDQLLGNSVNERVRYAYWQERLRTIDSGLAELRNL